MDLFESLEGKPRNHLNKDGVVHYYGQIMPLSEAGHAFNILFDDIKWRHDEAVIYGKRIITKRKVAWYGDKPFKYTYSNTTKQALPWIDELHQLKKTVEQITGETFNSCLLNLYHNGSEGMAWHSDGEKDLLKDGAIASLSFGAERKFSFRHKKTKESISIILQHGSLLVMKGPTQRYWQHCLPPTKKFSQARINLTFRSIVEIS